MSWYQITETPCHETKRHGDIVQIQSQTSVIKAKGFVFESLKLFKG